MHDITEIIIRAARGEASEADLRKLEIWRASAPVNEEWYADVRQLAELSRRRRRVDTEPVTARDVVEMAAVLEHRHTKVGPVASSRHRVASSRRRSKWGLPLAAAAAAAAVMVGVSGLVDRVSPDRRSDFMEASHSTEYRTTAEHGRSIRVTGGILAHLGPSTLLEVRGTGREARLWLEGRAFFGVEGRPDRPVIIETPGGSISVLGTRFEAYSQEQELQLLVVDGMVGVAAGGEEVTVTRGERGVVSHGVIAPPVRIEDPLVELGWMGRGMVFQGTPLEKVAEEIAFRYGVSVTLAGGAVSERTLTTVFDGEPLDVVVDVVCRALQIACELDDSGVAFGVE